MLADADGATPAYAHLRDRWANAPAVYSDIGVSILEQPVMETWEAPYMEKIAAAACSAIGAGETPARILEVGFGLGISGRFIHHELDRALQRGGDGASGVLCEHVVVEANADIQLTAEAFKEEVEAAHPGHRVTLVRGFWQDVCPSMEDGSFDGICFDCYPLTWQETVDGECATFFAQAARLLREGGVFFFYFDAVESWVASKRIFAEESTPALRAAGFRAVEADEAEVVPESEHYFWKTRFVVPICKR